MQLRYCCYLEDVAAALCQRSVWLSEASVKFIFNSIQRIDSKKDLDKSLTYYFEAFQYTTKSFQMRLTFKL